MKIIIKDKVSYENLVLISETISQLYESGVDFVRIMELVSEQELNSCYKRAVLEIKEEILKGEGLYESFSKNKELFPTLFLELLSAGENSGDIPTVLDKIANYYRKLDDVKKEIRKSMVYPITLLVTSILVFILFVFLVLPTFKDLFNSQSMGLLSFLLEFRNYVINKPLEFISFFICWGALLLILIKELLFKKGKYLLKYSKIYNERLEYLILILVDIVLSSGVSIQKGLTFYKDSSDLMLLKETMEELSSYIYKGYKIHDALKLTGVFSNYSLAIIKAGEEGGNLESSIHRLTENLEKNTKAKFDIIIKNITPFMTIMMAGIIGFVLVNFLNSFLGMLYGGIGGK